jgi:hypothetical protein
MSRPIYIIAKEIAQDWLKVNFAARPYLEAMFDLHTMEDMYYADSAPSIVAYFLGNAQSWHGDTAQRIKAELNEMLKEVYKS